MVFSHIHSVGDFPLLILLPSTPTFTPQVSQNRKERRREAATEEKGGWDYFDADYD